MKKYLFLILMFSFFIQGSFAKPGEPLKESGDLCCDQKTQIGTCCKKALVRPIIGATSNEIVSRWVDFQGDAILLNDIQGLISARQLQKLRVFNAKESDLAGQGLRKKYKGGLTKAKKDQIDKWVRENP